MRLFLAILLLNFSQTFCQQTGQFTQFTFNKYGYNPAAAGSSAVPGIDIVTGIRKQWIGFENGPGVTFVGANYTIRKERSYKRWHNVGFYYSKEKAGLFRNEGYYASYSLHLPITNKYKMSFGIFAGVRKFAFDKKLISPSDPVYGITYPDYFSSYPDFIPGIRIYNNKVFFDVSIQQLIKNKQVQGNKQIGTKSALTPQIYISYGKRINTDNGFVLVPAINVHSGITSIPSIEFNMMAYYNKRIGIGATIRNKDFISGIVQIRLYSNIVAGFAYDYSTNRLNSVASNSVEFMLGFTPLMNFVGGRSNANVSKCPSFDF
jgi:type IX secretion system PorP/SprF family membrane protein